MTRNEVGTHTRLRQAVIDIADSMDELLTQMAEHLHADDDPDRDASEAINHAAFDQFVRTTLDDVSRPLLGMGFLPNSTLIPGAAIRWWYRRSINDSVTLRPLPVSTHPGAVDYYDPVSTEWWREAASAPTSTVSGPYVDISGTNAYIVTFARAIRRAADLLGVVAIDVSVATLQALWQDDLLDLPRPTSVISSAGLVIATNAGNLLGNGVELHDPADDERCEAIQGTPWYLLTTA